MGLFTLTVQTNIVNYSRLLMHAYGFVHIDCTNNIVNYSRLLMHAYGFAHIDCTNNIKLCTRLRMTIALTIIAIYILLTVTMRQRNLHDSVIACACVVQELLTLGAHAQRRLITPTLHMRGLQ